jgi:hypothetical protein
LGEKETMAATEVAARSGTLNVSATPGGSQTASLTGKVPNLVETPGGDDLADDGGTNDRKGLNAVNVKLA